MTPQLLDDSLKENLVVKVLLVIFVMLWLWTGFFIAITISMGLHWFHSWILGYFVWLFFPGFLSFAAYKWVMIVSRYTTRFYEKMTNDSSIEIWQQHSLQTQKVQWLSTCVDIYFRDIESTYLRYSEEKRIAQKIFLYSLLCLFLCAGAIPILYNVFLPLIAIKIAYQFLTVIGILAWVIITIRVLCYIVSLLYNFPRFIFSLRKSTRYNKLYRLLKQLDSIDLMATKIIKTSSKSMNIGEYLDDLQQLATDIDGMEKFRAQLYTIITISPFERIYYTMPDHNLITNTFSDWATSIEINLSKALKNNLALMRAEIRDQQVRVQELVTNSIEFAGVTKLQAKRLADLEKRLVI